MAGWGVIEMTVQSGTLSGLFLLTCVFWFPGMERTAFSQDKAGEKAGESNAKAAAKAKLPALYSRLGLSSDQTRKVLEIQAKYLEEIQQLQRKMSALKEDMRQEMLQALGPEQRARLEELQKTARAKDKD